MKKTVFLSLIIVIILSSINSFANGVYNDKYSIDENLIEQISANVSNYTKINKIPEDLINAVVSVEDKRFYRHYGFDIIGIGRAFITNIKEGTIKEGGSTITQQLAKNLFFSNEKTLKRKLKELIVAIKIENEYTKDEILEMYLNLIYFGEESYGVQNASLTYFNKNVEDLSLEECAMLAGLPQAPSAYSPLKYPDKAKRRQERVLKAMTENGYVEQNLEMFKVQLKPEVSR
ncbi:penicillin-binding protein 1A [Gottschalkia purinilytica]|uniref:Penicillin-binding protein 1A n=1 Tax=Gottschalkia purinilytica TaxID=1503 RepID=A0A0L0WEZ5_GOTPU|nr:biosynthetic peptidoglycan transglycosylase [Gottschalkia purinilytica]KNF10001.1 penicillin-binding protein 1A [Gottschalkia purinilytica]